MDKLRALVIAGALLATSGAAMAERVYVKARGEVDLDTFACESVARSSANVRRICYDAKQQYLLVSLSGVWYHYCNVPAATVGEFRRSSSKGRFYNDSIRLHYECTATVQVPTPR
jgi:hypothetical protein